MFLFGSDNEEFVKSVAGTPTPRTGDRWEALLAPDEVAAAFLSRPTTYAITASRTLCTRDFEECGSKRNRTACIILDWQWQTNVSNSILEDLCLIKFVGRPALEARHFQVLSLNHIIYII